MIIGRENELRRLCEAYESETSEFVAVYGRRRVGKTFLVREAFDYRFTFQHSGLANEPKRRQLSSFRDSLVKQGSRRVAVPHTWFEAFDLLEEFVASSSDDRKVIFIDEMPWMDTSQSHFVSALEHFWNGFASARRDVLLIICGSASSWIVNNVFKNHGGLHNRVTKRIHLHPFDLHQCELLARHRRLSFTRYELLQCYMIMGGVPYYWSGLRKGLSLSQNIDALFFSPDGDFVDEFNALYASLFRHPEPYVSVIEALARKRAGMTRAELISSAAGSSSGNLTLVLQNLENCDFIASYNAYGHTKRGIVYQLRDNFTLFYLKFMKDKKVKDSHFWLNTVNTPQRNVWEGLAFEMVCFEHVPQIKQRLGIAGVMTDVFSWRVADDEVEGPGAQIDMLIDRADRVVNLCEMKFAGQEFLIDKSVDSGIKWKRGRFVRATRCKSSVHITFITPFGLVRNAYANEVQSQITAEDLFLPLWE